ncbi:MAG: non-ribosomal peptide synthetase [Cytophagales bacterium]|nr:non-ribosomal peptide synthetase [Cytophagales bacterium]
MSNESLIQQKLAEDFWIKKVAESTPTQLGRTRKADGAQARDTYSIELDHATRQKVLHTCNHRDLNVFKLLLAGLNTVLWKYTQSADILIGTSSFGTGHAATPERTAGSVVFSRAALNADLSVRQLLALVHNEVNECYVNGDFAFDSFLERFTKKELGSEQDLFDVGLFYRGFNDETEWLARFRLLVSVSPAEEGFGIAFEYAPEEYDLAFIKQLAAHFLRAIEFLLADPNRKLSAFELLSAAEREQLLHGFNQTEDLSLFRVPSVTQVFEEQAAQHPEAVAVVYEGNRLTYRELNEKINGFAGYIQESCGVKPGDAVGLFLERSEWMIIGMLGILKAGAAYLPIDADYPAERINFILADARVHLLVTTSDYLPLLEDYSGALLAVDVQGPAITGSALNPAPLGQCNDGNALAYVLYTSGSTGKPKGVMIGQQSLLNYVQWANAYYFADGPAGNFGLHSSLSFDFTITSIYCSLLRGKRLYIYPQHQDIGQILSHSFSPHSGIDAIKLTPAHVSLLEGLHQGPTGIVKVILGGEALSAGQVVLLNKVAPGAELYNEYGPTETTVGCVVEKLQGATQPVLIGRPIANTQVVVVDESLGLVPVGVKGEICIGGLGVGQGYVNRPELTEQKFIANPFGPGRLYRTGDVGRWLPEGKLEYLGRNDGQVKLKGYRIELGEVENALLRHEAVQNAVVKVWQDKDGEKQLVAYACGAPSLSAAELREFTKQTLPGFMVPAHFVVLDEFPMSVNGKVDKQALPGPESMVHSSGFAYEAPRNELEKMLLGVWEGVLAKANLSVYDSFFEVGGSSLKIVQLYRGIEQVLPGKVKITDLFDCPTISSQAVLIAGRTSPVGNAAREAAEVEETALQVVEF